MILRHQIWHVLSFQLSLFFADSSWNLPLFPGGVEKKHFLKDGKTKRTHSEVIPEILNKEESV